MLREWHLQAACRGRGPGDFVQGPKFDYEEVREICDSCPVRLDCLEFALSDDSITGLWGGTTDVERRLIRRVRVA
jgi:WhiB family transcriptional regulator, redox-sensing transcriptional regulator